MSFRPEELAGARPWKFAAFTTYALSLSFFESVVLDRLVRGGTEEALILADAEGVRAALSEQGAQSVGRDYELEPVAITGGAFHSKISFFHDESESHLLVGSGNLTFSGWGRNLELIEHLHPSFACDAFYDAADFFDALAVEHANAHGARDRCLRIAARLRGATAGHARSGSFRLLHSLGQTIGDKIVELADTLGGATRLAAAAPYWDGGHAVSTLCRALKLERVYVHAHPHGAVQGDLGDNWPRTAETEIVPVEVSEFAKDGRPLHAKAFEVLCRNGRIVVSGSANGTRAALYGRNVEACVARIQKEPITTWVLKSSAVPLPLLPREEVETDGAIERGVLRADLTGDMVSGRVLSPRMQGEATLSKVSTNGGANLCAVTLGADGTFQATVPDLERQSLRGGRLVLRIESSSGIAEGFASLKTATSLRRLAGKATRSLFAIICGAEAPEDVRVLMEWAYNNTIMLAGPSRSGAQINSAASDRGSTLLRSDLWNAAVPNGAQIVGHEMGEPGWARSLDALLSALRERRGPLGRDDVDDDGESKTPAVGRIKKGDPAALATGILDLVLDRLLAKVAAPISALRALDLAAFACDRLGDSIPRQNAMSWLQRSVDAAITAGVPSDRIADVTSAVLAISGTHPDREKARLARSRLLKGGIPLDAGPPDVTFAKPFLEPNQDEEDFGLAWEAVQNVTTWREQARSYVDALQAEGYGDGFEELLTRVPAEAGILREALRSDSARKRVLVLKEYSQTCCSLHLPKMEIAKLKQYGVARDTNRCQRVLIWPEAPHGEGHD